LLPVYVFSNLDSFLLHLSFPISERISLFIENFTLTNIYSYLYQFQKLGDDDNEPEFSSTRYPSFGMANPTEPLPQAFFRPRPLDNLAIADEMESLNPIVDSKVLNILPNSDTPQIFAACGRGTRSSLRILRHGLEVEESVSSDLPGIPNAVWTTKRTEDGQFTISFFLLKFLGLFVL
jgi:splicing factor 3B subunit 3